MNIWSASTARSSSSAFSMVQYDAVSGTCKRATPVGSRSSSRVNPDDPAGGRCPSPTGRRFRYRVGIRIIDERRRQKRDPTDPGLGRILRAAVKHDFPVNMLCWGTWMRVAALIDRHPDTRFIIDHLGILQPERRPRRRSRGPTCRKCWTLPNARNAVIKVSGAARSPKTVSLPGHLGTRLARVSTPGVSTAACGHGTGLAHSRSSTTAGRLSPSLELTALSDSERAMLMGGACAKAYGWSPKNG